MRRTVYRCSLFSVEEEHIKKPRDIMIKRVRGRDAVIVIPFIGKNKVLIEKQYRYAIKRRVYEFPAGYIEDGETPERAAARELEEETGYKAGKMEFLLKAYFSPGTHTSVAYYFLAKDLVKTRERREKDEVIRTVPIGINNLTRIIDKEEVKSNTTLVGMFYCMGRR